MDLPDEKFIENPQAEFHDGLAAANKIIIDGYNRGQLVNYLRDSGIPLPAKIQLGDREIFDLSIRELREIAYQVIGVIRAKRILN